MRVSFVGLGWEQLGISQLSAIAKQSGHEVFLAFSVALFNDRAHMTYPSIASFFDDTALVLKVIEKQRPDVLAFSPISGTYQWMLKVAQRAKHLFPHVKIIFGGVHTTALPQLVLAQSVVDYVCIGEGDVAFPLILKAIDEGGPQNPIPNTHFKLPSGQSIKGPQIDFFQNLDALPILDKELWEDYMQFKDSYITMGSRGCPYRCTFCFNNFFAKLPDGKKGNYVRYRSVDHLMAELRWAKKRYNIQLVEFFDDVFTFNKKWLKQLLVQYKKDIGVPFQIFTHIKFMDEETIRFLSDAGCRSAQIGVQTLDETYKQKFLHRNETADQIEKALKLMKKYKVFAKLDHMLGLPGESLDAQETARNFYVQNPPYVIQTYWVNYYPGTELQAQAFEQGILSEIDLKKLNNGEWIDSFTHSNKTIASSKIKQYETYQLIFKLLPHFPIAIRKRLTPKFFKFFPPWMCAFLTFIVELLSGLFRWDVDYFVYAKFYIFHIYRLFCSKLGVKIPRASLPRVYDPVPKTEKLFSCSKETDFMGAP